MATRRPISGHEQSSCEPAAVVVVPDRALSVRDIANRGFTTRDVAGRYRVSEEKVRAWIRRGELTAIDTAEPGKKPRYVVPPEALTAFEQRRSANPTPKSPRRRRNKDVVDYYPD